MPALWPGAPSFFAWAKHQNTTREYQNRIATAFRNENWLRSKSLDEVATEMEKSIHGWMHLHWSGQPPADPWNESIENDWLGAPFSSHVNDIFWKLHGFIDDTIEIWENANQQQADFSDGWTGATGYLPEMQHTANPQLLIELNVKNKPLRIMTWKVPILEGVNDKDITVDQL